MRNVKIGSKEFKLVASPITLYFYKKEFGKDLIGDLMAFQKYEVDPASYDSIIILQMAWAMIKTAKIGNLEAFEQWLSNLDFVSFGEGDMMTNIVEEATEGFFREIGKDELKK